MLMLFFCFCAYVCICFDLLKSLDETCFSLPRFGMHVEMGTIAYAGCPNSSVRGKDLHSDKEACRLLNPGYFKQNMWDSHGWSVFQFFGNTYVYIFFIRLCVLEYCVLKKHNNNINNNTIAWVRFWNSLAFAGWIGSMGYTTKELFSNCLSAYYVALINTWYAWGIRGKKFPLLWLPLTTLRNVVRMLANLALRLHAWPEDITCEPAMTMEDTIEYWFGLLKSWKKGVNGTSTTANALMAAQLLHLRNSTHRTQAGYDHCFLGKTTHIV